MKKLFVLLGAVVLVVAFTAPSFAAEWSFYGSARITTFWTDVSKEIGPNDSSDLDLTHALQGNSRIGANVKVSDNLVGRFEYGSGPNLRILWGEYDFGGFKLGLGQHYTPLNWFPSNQVYDGDADLLGTGGVYNGRRAMVQAKVGGLKIALVQPNTPDVVTAADIAAAVGGGAVAADYGTDIDVVLPQIQASYKLNLGGVSLEIAGGYQTYEQEGYEIATGDSEDEAIDSYIGAIIATYNMGPFYFATNGWMGKNVGNLGFAGFGNPPNHFASFDGDDVLDNNGYGFLLVAAFSLSDMLKFEAGYGYAEADLDDAESEDDSSSYYLNCTINLAKGVFIVPEIGAYNLGDDEDGEDQGDITYYGLKWQINF